MVSGLNLYFGKVALVAGAASEIGAAIVKELVQNGIIVAGLAKRIDRVEEMATKLSGEKGQLFAFKCDITNEEETISVVRNVIKKLGNISILINSSGLMEETDLIFSNTQRWKVIVDTDIVALCVTTKEVVQNMKASGLRGHIIHVSNLLKHIIMEISGVDIYGANKYSLAALNKSLELEINKERLPIKLTTVSPGQVRLQPQTDTGSCAVPFQSIYPSDVADAIIYALATPPHVNAKEIVLQPVRS